MRVSGRTAQPGESGVMGRRAQAMRNQRANSSSAAGVPTLLTMEILPSNPRAPKLDDGFFSPSRRPRADSAPMPVLLGAPGGGGIQGLTGTSMLTNSRLVSGFIDPGSGLLEQALSVSETSGDIEDNEFEETEDGTRDFSVPGGGGYEAELGSMMADSTRQSDMGITAGDASGPLDQVIMDEGSDVDEDIEQDEADALEEQDGIAPDRRKYSDSLEDRRRSSTDVMDEAPLDFSPIPLPLPAGGQSSGLTATLNKHIPHLVSTGSAPWVASSANPFASLYASVAASMTMPSIGLELYFPHSTQPTRALGCKVRKDATVEEVTGYGLFRFWEDERKPMLSEQDNEQHRSTVGWGLRIVEDDGEVDEDFPRQSDVSHMCTFDRPPC